MAAVSLSVRLLLPMWRLFVCAFVCACVCVCVCVAAAQAQGKSTLSRTASTSSTPPPPLLWVQGAPDGPVTAPGADDVTIPFLTATGAVVGAIVDAKRKQVCVSCCLCSRVSAGFLHSL